MKASEDIKPISYVKAHASELMTQLGTDQRTLVITQNGEAKAVLQDIHTYEETQETMAMLKILAMSQKDLSEGKHRPAKDVFADLREELK
ncbi:MAG: type II toxin-antitoxin system Phd/YefM family antitoxin [SAR324 cluster bacterium]|nr:type II toxin-antitoxin system Phd/YefM family antitoxin [SAR324 cluster bacterium]